MTTFTLEAGKRKHQPKCRGCGKLIAYGTKILFERHRDEKCYPVKGNMVFYRSFFWHKLCKEART